MAQSFWDAAASLISVTEGHPFLVSMVKGTLKPENFKYYTIQDSLYLSDFADCLKLLGDKMAGLNDEHSISLHRFAVAAEEDEKALHRNFFKR
jgi:thiaminase/transcriptional activator TenA